MYLQEILEVAIGLVVAWLVVSIATMSINEWIGSVVNLRAKEMEKVIAQMLSKGDRTGKFTKQFYDHPLIANLYTQAKNPNRKGRYPSYIPAQKFGAALFDLVLQAGTENSPVEEMSTQVDQELESIQSPEHLRLAREDWQAILETAKNIVASGLGSAAYESLKHQVQVYSEKYPDAQIPLDTLLPEMDQYYGEFVAEQQAVSESGANAGLAMRQFRLGLLALKKVNKHLYRSVTAIVRQTEGYALRADQMVANTRTNMETWFNDAMERLSGTYKRKTQLTAFIIGCLLALILNVDSVAVATSLWREPTLRQAVLDQAQKYTPPATAPAGTTPGPLESLPVLQNELQVLNIPFGWTTAPMVSFNPKQQQCNVLPLNKSLVWGLPSQDANGMATCNRVNNLPIDVYAWLLKILGLLMTGAAATQGAPFWFDMLGKLVNVRATGSNPAEKEPVG